MTLTNIDFKSGIVTYDGFDINPKILYHEQTANLEQDLLQISYKNDQYGIDVGWYPNYDPNGHFLIRVIKGYDWDNPVYSKTTKSFTVLKKNLQQCVDLVENLIKEESTEIRTDKNI